MERIIIDFEGIDGVGKGTQSKLLYQHLLSSGYSATYLTFPRYESFFGKMIGNYLNGSYGDLSSVPIKFVTLLYALDRWSYFENIEEESFIYIIDRYIPSNIAHQSSKIDEKYRKEFISWINYLEHEIFKLPKPDIVLLLDASADVTYNYILNKGARSYTNERMDIHENDKIYLNKVRDVFHELINYYNDFHIINCENDKKLRPIEEISNEILKIVTSRLEVQMKSSRNING